MSQVNRVTRLARGIFRDEVQCIERSRSINWLEVNGMLAMATELAATFGVPSVVLDVSLFITVWGMGADGSCEGIPVVVGPLVAPGAMVKSGCRTLLKRIFLPLFLLLLVLF